MQQSELPVTNSTHTDLDRAARWYADNRQKLTGAFIPELRRRFGLTTLQAIEAGKLAHKIEQDGDHG
ncbi:MAG: hypothetical protein GY807_13730 [Gammaproteobacteria bacterium]|nr:hypothetical protein [Gammaproteobacteria bacterium]